MTIPTTGYVALTDIAEYTGDHNFFSAVDADDGQSLNAQFHSATVAVFKTKQNAAKRGTPVKVSLESGDVDWFIKCDYYKCLVLRGANKVMSETDLTAAVVRFKDDEACGLWLVSLDEDDHHDILQMRGNDHTHQTIAELFKVPVSYIDQFVTDHFR